MPISGEGLDHGMVGRRSVNSSARFAKITQSGILVVLGLMGCGSDSGPSSDDVDIAKSVESGFLAIEGSDWKGADEKFTTALDSKTLSGDRYEEVLLARAKARVRSENLEGAGEDILTLEQGASAMDQVLALKAELLLKKGDQAAARASAAEARKINPKVELPPGLK